MLIDAAAGLMHIHESGFVHGDIACRNVFVSYGYRAKIGDFGLASKVEDGKTYGRTDSNEMPILVIK